MDGGTDGRRTTGDSIGTAFPEPKSNFVNILLPEYHKFNETQKLDYDKSTLTTPH